MLPALQLEAAAEAASIAVRQPGARALAVGHIAATAGAADCAALVRMATVEQATEAAYICKHALGTQWLIVNGQCLMPTGYLIMIQCEG